MCWCLIQQHYFQKLRPGKAWSLKLPIASTLSPSFGKGNDSLTSPLWGCLEDCVRQGTLISWPSHSLVSPTCSFSVVLIPCHLPYFTWPWSWRLFLPACCHISWPGTASDLVDAPSVFVNWMKCLAKVEGFGHVGIKTHALICGSILALILEELLYFSGPQFSYLELNRPD